MKKSVLSIMMLALVAFTSCDSNDPIDPKSSASIPAIAEAINGKTAEYAVQYLLDKGYVDGTYLPEDEDISMYSFYYPNAPIRDSFDPSKSPVVLFHFWIENGIVNQILAQQTYDTRKQARDGYLEWNKHLHRQIKSPTIWFATLSWLGIDSGIVNNYQCDYVDGKLAEEYAVTEAAFLQKYYNQEFKVEGEYNDYVSAVRKISTEQVFALKETYLQTNEQNIGSVIFCYCTVYNDVEVEHFGNKHYNTYRLNNDDYTEYINQILGVTE